MHPALGALQLPAHHKDIDSKESMTAAIATLPFGVPRYFRIIFSRAISY